MKYHEKLRIFFKAKGLSQKKVAETMVVSPAMMGRYLSGSDNFSPEFITKLVKEFPEIDLKYIFTEDENIMRHDTVMEPPSEYKKKEDVLSELEIIENKIALIKIYLAQNCHNK